MLEDEVDDIDLFDLDRRSLDRDRRDLDRGLKDQLACLECAIGLLVASFEGGFFGFDVIDSCHGAFGYMIILLGA